MKTTRKQIYVNNILKPKCLHRKKKIEEILQSVIVIRVVGLRKSLFVSFFTQICLKYKLLQLYNEKSKNFKKTNRSSIKVAQKD